MEQSLIDEKIKQSKIVAGFFADSAKNELAGKRILDIGFGLGYNPLEMIRNGADVYGVEPDKECYDYATNTLGLDRNRFFNILAQDIPESYNDSFDMITCFNCNIGIGEYDKVFDKLAMLVKPGGVVNIYFSEPCYNPRIEEPSSMFFKIHYLMFRSFASVGVPIIRDDISANGILYECKEPRKWLISMEKERGRR